MREDHNTRLAANITKKELLMAIAISPNNKAPGLDGLSYEFYQLSDILSSPIFWRTNVTKLCQRLSFPLLGTARP
jgi:hypothetical protein